MSILALAWLMALSSAGHILVALFIAYQCIFRILRTGFTPVRVVGLLVVVIYTILGMASGYMASNLFTVARLFL